MDITSLIGEATAYDEKETLEERRPKSWFKSVYAFANGSSRCLPIVPRSSCPIRQNSMLFFGI